MEENLREFTLWIATVASQINSSILEVAKRRASLSLMLEGIHPPLDLLVYFHSLSEPPSSSILSNISKRVRAALVMCYFRTSQN